MEQKSIEKFLASPGSDGAAVAVQHRALPSALARPLHGEDKRVRVSLVIPALNEARNLPHVLTRIPDCVDEVVLVDGGSRDGTVEVARELCPAVRVVGQTRKGKGNALRSGFEAACGDMIVMMDADVSMDPAEIPLFVGALLGGADLAKGSRFLQGGGTADMQTYRRLGNMAFVWMVRAMFGGKYSDLCYGYAAFWKDILPRLDLDSDGFEIETLMNIRALRTGLRIVEVPSFEYRRLYGEGRLRTIPDGFRVLRTILRERGRQAPARAEIDVLEVWSKKAASNGQRPPAEHGTLLAAATGRRR